MATAGINNTAIVVKQTRSGNRDVHQQQHHKKKKKEISPTRMFN
jgi:hypothetical protein